MILVDSDVLIAHLRGVLEARDWLIAAARRSTLAASALSVVEIAGGMRSGEKREVWALFTALRVQPVTVGIARRGAEFMRRYRSSHSGIGTVDYVVAATAVELGAELATLNVRHFPMIVGLRAPFRLSGPRRGVAIGEEP
ncbi:MAG: type II toxin-antitoxin system VapC family toxin [Bifidobacteriaceae bacterium]|nr:type II toxin-antitoxin system VapC family toxin [Bifidobacteriaceae bacterium]